KKILLGAFLKLSFNPKDEEMCAFVRKNFAADDILAYWKRAAEDSTPNTLGAQDFFADYFAMSDDLSLLTQACQDAYTPLEYAKQLATSRIFEETKQPKDPIKLSDLSSSRETPESISVVMGKVFGLGLRNPSVARHIPIEKGIAEIAQILPDAEKLIMQAMKERMPRNESFEKIIKTFYKANEKIVEDSESVDIYEPENLVYYKRGNTLSKGIWEYLRDIREVVDKHKTRMRKDFDKHYGKDEIRDKVYARMLVLASIGKHLLPKTAWDYFESRIADDRFFDIILGLHALGSDTVPICYYVKGILYNRELFDDVMLNVESN
ncbi:MAG: hypothetical protein FWD57_12315, partial [Polyangiaceae bacterium]|nr:hypothetical protein [Polyangiaceae bacterium]